MPSEPLNIFDPRQTFYMQGFTGRGATTTIHDATETGISISGMFQAAEDFAVLGFYNAYDYFNHLRVKPLPRTDFSGLKLEFDIDYDHTLDGAMRLDAAKYPSVAWNAMTFVCGAGDLYEVPLIQHATAIGGGETPASVSVSLSGVEPNDGGVDYVHLHFRDTRYTVAHTDCRVETRLAAAIATTSSTPQWFAVQSAARFEVGDEVWLERTGTNEEIVRIAAVGPGQLQAVVTKTHGNGSFVTRKTLAKHMAAALVASINTPGETVAGRFGPDQTAIIAATLSGSTITLTFQTVALPATRYGKLGNIDRVLFTSGRTMEGANGIAWAGGDGSARFTGGDNDTRYRIALDFRMELRDRLNRVVPMNDCRKMYMVFAPRFENVEEALEDGATLTAGVGAADTTWQVDDDATLTGGRYFIGTPTSEERVRLLSANGQQITVERGFESSTPTAWPSGTRIKKLSPLSGFPGNVEWRATISNMAITGDASLKVGGGSARIEESDKRCEYAGFWEQYKYGAAGWPSQWWSGGHGRRTGPNDALDVRKVTIKYSYPKAHSLVLGTFLYTDCGKISVRVDGDVTTTHDLYLNEYGGTTAMVPLRAGVAAGNHTVEITALFDRNAASGGHYFYFDYLWPLEPQDVPDAPEQYADVSLAIDFDTDHGYKKPPAWHLWQLQKLGFKGHADVYMGVFWNNKRRRINATYPWATVQFSGTPAPGDVVWFEIDGTRVAHAIGYGETLQQIVSHMRASINGMFAGVWADDNFGGSTTLRIQSKAPGYTFPGVQVSPANSLTLTLDNHLDLPGTEGDWEMIDSVSPVMTEGARRWIRDLASQFKATGIEASFAFSMECYVPPSEMRARYLHYENGAVSPGSEVFLPIPSHHMHFGTRVRNYLRQMYKECADEIAAAGLPIVLQFGETQFWYFDNIGNSIHGDIDPLGGMPFYDQETIDAFRATYGRDPWPFRKNTDDPAGDPAHPFETADFMRDRIWEYCQAVISYVKQYHPTAVFECLWPLDANQGKPAPDPKFRALNFHVNLPEQWKNSSYGIKYFRAEGFDYDVWQRNASLIEQIITFPSDVLGRPAEECMFLSGIYGPPDPPMAVAYGLWRREKLYSLCFWAFDQFCLNSRPVPLEIGGSVKVTGAQYLKPRAARAYEAAHAIPVVPASGGALNRFHANQRKFNG